MRNLSLFILAAPLLLTGCPSGGGSTITGLEKPPLSSAPTPATTVQLCEKNCEKAPLDAIIHNPNWKPLQLSPAETTSLNHALTTDKPPQHLDASVLNGKLVFTPHADAAHAETSTTILNLPTQHATIKLAATPEAIALLQKQAHN